MKQNLPHGLHRLSTFNYHAARAYWITISTYERANTLSRIHEDEVILTDAGHVVNEHLQHLSERVPATVDAFVIMPNHVHLILVMLPKSDSPIEGKSNKTVSDVVRSFKTYTAVEINRKLQTPGRPFWQRNYYERIIRNEHEHDKFLRYIADNPRSWQFSHDDSAGPDDLP